MKTNSNFSCFLDTIFYKGKNSVHYSEKTDSLSCSFRGTLKVGLLRFKTGQVNLLMGKQIGLNGTSENGIQLTGKFDESEDSTFGMFKRHPSSCLNVQFQFAQNTSWYTGSFCAICNMFGIKKSVNVSISHKDVKFQVRGKVYDRFDAKLNCSSSILLPWENQVFDVDGTFERNAKETDLVAILRKELQSYAKHFILQAVQRKDAADRTVKRARIRQENILPLKSAAVSKLQHLTRDYAVAKKHYETAKGTLKTIQMEARNYSKEVDGLELRLKNLCNIKQCNQVCQEDIYCTTCYEYITENSKGMCPATCFRTNQRRIPPYSEVVYCDRPKCKRIHSTNGLFKRIFGGFLGGIVKSLFSFVVSTVTTAFGVPEPISRAIGSGVTAFLDTGRVDHALCSASKTFSSGNNLIVRGLKTVASIPVKCQREQKDGHWKCKIVKVKCNKGRHVYQYENYPYECKKPCVIQTITKTIEKSCCKTMKCATLVPNVTCVVENTVCKKARLRALERISKTKSLAKNILQNLEYAKSNVSYWNMKMQKRYSRVLRQERWVNITLKSAYSLEKAYNSTIESKKELDILLSKPLKLMSLFNEQLTSADGIKLKEIRFKTKVSPANEEKLLPIDIRLEANGTQRQLSTVLDFAQLNTSLKSISEEIMVDITTNVIDSSRERRSVDILVTKPNTLLYSLKKYHSYCAKFTNYHDVLYNVAQSLYNLTSEHLLFEKSIFKNDHSAFNVTNVIKSSMTVLNKTMESNYELNDGNYSSAHDYENDLELLEALQLRKEEMRQNYEWLNYTSKLLIYNWFATVEDIFNSSRINYECSGMSDCIIHILDKLLQMFSKIEADGVNDVQQLVKILEIQLEYLSNSTNTTIEEGLKISTEILEILEKMKEVELVCAQSPNITKQPEPLTEIGVEKVLVLNCDASGSSLLYSWTINGKTLEDQKSNVLTISNTTVSNSGNYTCIVSNHIAREKSIPAVVIIHPPPIIIKQPVEYLAAVLSGDDSLQCEVEETSNNVSYQWWFRPVNATASFSPLPNEIFPYINFSPTKTKNEGWYFCQVSNPHGETTSRISFVKALSFTLPVPTVVLSFSLDRETQKVNSSFHDQPTNFTDYDVFASHILKRILLRNNYSKTLHVKNLRPIKCIFGTTKNEGNGNVEICDWEFQYIGRNVTSNVTIDNDFKVNARMVINATQELSDTIRRLVSAINKDWLSFSMAGNVYIAKRNTIAIRKYSLTCPRNQVLFQEDFKCGKLFFSNIWMNSFLHK